jgi:hypothetical protein
MGPWLKYALEFGFGFLDGLAQSRAERSNSHLTFADAMLHLSRETGYRVEITSATSARFDVLERGESYTVIVFEKGNLVQINAMSNIGFYSGHAPREMNRALREQNEELATCQFDLYSGQQGDLFLVKTWVRCEALDVAIFEAAINEVVPRVAALDRVLRRNGYDS